MDSPICDVRIRQTPIGEVVDTRTLNCSGYEAKAPIGRLGDAEEVAVAALLLVSSEAQFVSGTGLNVDGGAIVQF